MWEAKGRSSNQYFNNKQDFKYLEEYLAQCQHSTCLLLLLWLLSDIPGSEVLFSFDYLDHNWVHEDSRRLILMMCASPSSNSIPPIPIKSQLQDEVFMYNLQVHPYITAL